MATETVSAAPADLRAALEVANKVLYDNYRSARALLALLDKAEFADALACVGAGDEDHYILLYAIEQLLTQIRDRSRQASEQSDCALREEAAA